MNILTHRVEEYNAVVTQIHELLDCLGTGTIQGVAYDTAWVARLAKRFPEYNFEGCIDWLRRHQYEDGTWGAPQFHYHDRFISTLAAIVALADVGNNSQDQYQIKRGENALWKLASHLGQDDSDTVGFPIVSIALAQDAAELGLEIPPSPIRYAAAYQKKVKAILAQSKRDWRKSALSFSLEGLYRAVGQADEALEANHSVASSPAATAAYLLNHDPNHEALGYLQSIQELDGSIPALAPIDVFEIIWSLNHLQPSGVLQPDHPAIRRLLDKLWEMWSPVTGLHFSTYFRVPDLDITSAGFILLRWGGYPVEADIFEYFEMEDHFCTYREEANPSPAAHLRLLMALQSCPEHPKQPFWLNKVLTALFSYDENGSFWRDKWHTSPYYVSDLAVRALIKVDPKMVVPRLKWVLKTQNADGGWGYLGGSTPEETAYCIDALLCWDRTVEPVEADVLSRAEQFLTSNLYNQDYTPLWISKGLYTPRNIVKAIILNALCQSMERNR